MKGKRQHFSKRELLEPFIYTQRVIVYSCEGSAQIWKKKKHWKWQKDADMRNDEAFRAIATPGT